MDVAPTGSPAVKTHDLNPPPGEAAAHVVQQASPLQEQLAIERRRFTKKYGRLGEDCRPLAEIRLNLAKDDDTYLRLASRQVKVVEGELTSFQLSLSGKNEDLLGYFEALDPNYMANTKEAVDTVVNSMSERHKVYTERMTEILQQLSDLQRRVNKRNNASRKADQQPNPVITSSESPRFTPREGAPGKLADSINPRPSPSGWLSSMTG